MCSSTAELKSPSSFHNMVTRQWQTVALTAFESQVKIGPTILGVCISFLYIIMTPEIHACMERLIMDQILSVLKPFYCDSAASSRLMTPIYAFKRAEQVRVCANRLHMYQHVNHR